VLLSASSFMKLVGTTPPLPYLGAGEGLAGSLPDSIIVGRIGPISIVSAFVPRGLEGGGVLLCSIGVSLFNGLGVSGATGLGAGALGTSGSRVLAGCETDGLFNPSAARAPAARISSRLSAAGADFFSRDLDFRGVGAGVGVSEGICSEG